MSIRKPPEAIMPADLLDDERTWQGDLDPYLAQLAHEGRKYRPPPRHAHRASRARPTTATPTWRSSRVPATTAPTHRSGPAAQLARRVGGALRFGLHFQGVP
jgi:hypothetical protein